MKYTIEFYEQAITGFSTFFMIMGLSFYSIISARSHKRLRAGK